AGKVERRAARAQQRSEAQEEEDVAQALLGEHQPARALERRAFRDRVRVARGGANGFVVEMVRPPAVFAPGLREPAGEEERVAEVVMRERVVGPKRDRLAVAR